MHILGTLYISVLKLIKADKSTPIEPTLNPQFAFTYLWWKLRIGILL